MTLRLKIHLIVGVLTLAFVAIVLALQLRGMRAGVNEEVVAANRVAAQLLNRIGWGIAAQGGDEMVAFLQGVGRIRSNDIVLLDGQGRERYRSPPPTYKAGRDAPGWFAALIVPPASVQSIEYPDGKLVITSNASRAAIDAWDDFVLLLAAGAGLLVVVNGLVGVLVGRTVRPFGEIVRALGQLESGRFDVELRPLAGQEAGAIGRAFNRMVGVLRDHIETEKRAVRAEQQLQDSRELSRWLDHHIEQERRMIARELHDELGQSVTAMRSLALSVAQRCEGRDASAQQAATLIAQEASRLYDAMHGLIPRLTPLVLDHFGLDDALADLADRTRRAHPALQLDLHGRIGGRALATDAALALYRAAQEGLTNALRHGQAGHVRLAVQADDDGVTLTLDDDGRGLPADGAPRAGHHGLRWLDERVQALQGRFELRPRSPRGATLHVWLPAATVAPAPADATADMLPSPALPAHVLPPPAAAVR